MTSNESTIMAKGRKTITIDDDTYNELAKLGDLSETFDSVIRRLVKEHNDRKRDMKEKHYPKGGTL
jgi:predicted CopG family antitoxin